MRVKIFTMNAAAALVPYLPPPRPPPSVPHTLAHALTSKDLWPLCSMRWSGQLVGADGNGMPPTAKCSVTSAIQRPPRFVRPGDGKRWWRATEKRTDRISARKLTYSEPSKTTMIGNEEEAARSNDDFFRLAMARVSSVRGR